MQPKQMTSYDGVIRPKVVVIKTVPQMRRRRAAVVAAHFGSCGAGPSCLHSFAGRARHCSPWVMVSSQRGKSRVRTVPGRVGLFRCLSTLSLLTFTSALVFCSSWSKLSVHAMHIRLGGMIQILLERR